jgi:hypothetical protein
MQTLKRISEALGVPIESFLNDRAQMVPREPQSAKDRDELIGRLQAIAERYPPYAERLVRLIQALKRTAVVLLFLLVFGRSCEVAADQQSDPLKALVDEALQKGILSKAG